MHAKPPARKWRPSWLTVLIAVLILAGLGVGLYPMTAAWVTSYNQSQVLQNSVASLAEVDPTASQQLAMAQRYNDSLTAGVVVGANQNVATGDGRLADATLDYRYILTDKKSEVMSRIKIDSIDVDLPVYHGTGEDSLLRGAGHLEGSHLPIGGDSTRTVITAHRGLASATMFTNLDKVVIGDTFVIETFGRVMTYRVNDIKVIDPDETDTIRVVAGEDLATLITCTPLGINSQRIVVTGERITPTPKHDLDAAGAAPAIPGFAWWALWGALGTAVVAGYLLYQGRVDARLYSAVQRKRE